MPAVVRPLSHVMNPRMRNGLVVTALPVQRSRHGDRTRVVSAPDPRAVRLLLISSQTGRVTIVRDDP